MTVKKYLSIVLDGMAKGLFASLIVGVIIKQVGIYSHIKQIEILGQTAQYFMGPCIGIGVAFTRNSKHFTLISSAVAGAIGAGTIRFLADTGTYVLGIGEPVGAMIAALAAVELGKYIEGKTKFDLLIVPTAVVLVGGLVGTFVSPALSVVMGEVGIFVNELTLLHPIPMGILLGIVVGMILTLPVSSAALCISIQISGLAAGAALAGCCAQMVGFAVMSFRENGWSGLIAQGVGTSMIQVPNIVKKPIIWIPSIVASGIGGVLSTTLFKMETTAVGAGMGTSGLVGQFTTFSVMGLSISTALSVLLLHFIIPIVITLAISEFMRKKQWILLGDLQL